MLLSYQLGLESGPLSGSCVTGRKNRISTDTKQLIQGGENKESLVRVDHTKDLRTSSASLVMKRVENKRLSAAALDENMILL